MNIYKGIHNYNKILRNLLYILIKTHVHNKFQGIIQIASNNVITIKFYKQSIFQS